MTELPRNIAGWSEPLAILREELVGELSVWLPRLATLFGPMRSQDQAGQVTVDGVSGLSRRGSYERLLASEWAIRSAAPLEFLRRAAGSEHLFVDLKRQEPAGSRRCLVLLDSGPDQLGVPRIVQLAALIVLARRAEAAGAELQWGCIQRSAHPPWDNADRIALGHLLKNRSAEPPTAEGFSAWLASLDHPRPGDELWVLGGDAAAGLAPRGATILTITDPPHPADPIGVTLRRSGSGQRRLALPMPAAAHQATLLTRPFRPEPTAPQASAAPAGTISPLRPCFTFSHSGARLLGIEASGAYVGIRLPIGERPPRVERLSIPHGFRVVAMGWHKGAYILIYNESTEELSVYARNAQETLQAHDETPYVMDLLSPAPVFLQRSQSRRRTRFLMLGEVIDYHHHTREPELHATGCLGLWMRDGRSMMVADRGAGLQLIIEAPDRTPIQQRPIPAGSTAAFAGFLRGAHYGLVVAGGASGDWVAHHNHTEDRIPVSRGTTVYGCMGIGKHNRKPALLVCSADGLTLALSRQDMLLALPTESARVVYAAASPCTPHVAWMTESGSVHIWDVAQDAAVTTLTADALSGGAA